MKKSNSKKSNSTKIYEEVTKKIVKLLETQLESFDCPWNLVGSNGPAKNLSSNKQYRGINQLLLAISCEENTFQLNNWLTYKQASEMGGQVRKGERGTKIYFSSKLHFDGEGKKQKEKNEDTERSIWYLKGFTVFNVLQIDGLKDEVYVIPETKVFSEFQRNELCESVMNGTGAKIEIKVSNKACYVHFPYDKIIMPEREQFKGEELFYETCFHELGHWTGAESRLKRDMSGSRKTKNKDSKSKYATEELVAELTSAFVCARLGFAKGMTRNATYLKSWLGALNDDVKLIFIASAQAQKAADYIFEKCEKNGVSVEASFEVEPKEEPETETPKMKEEKFEQTTAVQIFEAPVLTKEKPKVEGIIQVIEEDKKTEITIEKGDIVWEFLNGNRVGRYEVEKVTKTMAKTSGGYLNFRRISPNGIKSVRITKGGSDRSYTFTKKGE